MPRKILQILVILVLASFIVSTTRQVLKLNEAKGKFQKAEGKLENLKSENEKLQGELKFRESSEFVEEAARNQLGLAKEGETIVVLPKSDEKTGETGQKDTGINFWLKRLFGS